MCIGILIEAFTTRGSCYKGKAADLRSEEIGNTEKQKRKYSLGGKEAQLPFIKVKEIQKYKYCEGGREAQLT